jgi:putative DNA primase/helicase
MTKPKAVVVSVEAQRMLKLFPASGRWHGWYDPSDPGLNRPRADGKVKPDKFNESKTPVTAEVWQRHLAGEISLAVGLACDDGSTRVTCVDVDLYGGVNFIGLLAQIDGTGLPLFVSRSKSAGAHVFAFHDEPITIEASEKVAAGIARKLRLQPADIELFPPVQGDGPLPTLLYVPFCGGGAQEYPDTGVMQPGSKVAGTLSLAQFLRLIEKPENHTTADQRAQLVKVPKETAPTSAEEGHRYAANRLQRYVNEMKVALPGGRNNMMAANAFYMGTLGARGWIKKDAVLESFKMAVASWNEEKRHMDTFDRQWEAGFLKPHADLGDENVVTEDGAALEFAERHATDLRFDHDAGRWFRWDGFHWQRERTPYAFSEARDLVRQLSKDQKQRVRNITSKANFAGNVERYAKADRALVATQETWDRDTFLLGTPAGTVDLTTGVLRDADPLEYISKVTAVAPAPTPDCPLWMRFLSEATDGNDSLVRYLQIICGYALTGEVNEHLLIFIHGDGGNGKGVFINTIARIMHQYAIEAAPDMFLASAFDRHPTDLADLRGARLVTSSDTSTGRTWNDDRIKRLTGGDKVKGRFMRQDFFEFYPQFLLLFIGNDPPSLQSVSEAMKRRLRMVPFLHKPTKPDTQLTKRLELEWPGILRWMIDGCLLWQRENVIAQPDIVTKDTDRYFEDQDIFAQWFEFAVQRTKTDNKTLSDNELFSNWEHWAAQAGAEPGDKRWFNRKLRGEPYALQDARSNGVNRFAGVEWKKVSARGDQMDMGGI